MIGFQWPSSFVCLDCNKCNSFLIRMLRMNRQMTPASPVSSLKRHYCMTSSLPGASKNMLIVGRPACWIVGSNIMMLRIGWLNTKWRMPGMHCSLAWARPPSHCNLWYQQPSSLPGFAGCQGQNFFYGLPALKRGDSLPHVNSHPVGCSHCTTMQERARNHVQLARLRRV